jgi:hypothetical protein
MWCLLGSRKFYLGNILLLQFDKAKRRLPDSERGNDPHATVKHGTRPVLLAHQIFCCLIWVASIAAELAGCQAGCLSIKYEYCPHGKHASN